MLYQTVTHLCEGIQEVSDGLLLVQLLHVLPLLWYRSCSLKQNQNQNQAQFIRQSQTQTE